MTFRIEKTRFYVDEKIYLEIIKTGCALEIAVNPKKGRHPRGIYSIPNNVIVAFIKSKRNKFNWINNKDFKQDGIPTDLKAYFKEV